MASVAIITARGGSKRIPGKNIKSFCGKPIIAWSIEAALGSGLFDEVMVSTDSEEIAGVARSYGASVPFMRSGASSDDHATTADVIREVLASYEAQGRHFDRFLCLYPTAPFVTADRLREAGRIMEEKKSDAVVTAVRFSFPVQRGFVLKEDYLTYKWPEYRSARSQDLEPFYHDAGQFYLVRTDAFLTENTVVPQKSAPLILPDTQVQDIDNPEDWSIAEIKFTCLHPELMREGH